MIMTLYIQSLPWYPDAVPFDPKRLKSENVFVGSGIQTWTGDSWVRWFIQIIHCFQGCGANFSFNIS